MTDAHLSIGEVLTLLQNDFPDITISKIRFLESQGLISPERTPSGYRKFYGPDIERLRWILLQQRENFLPLKVIKERLEKEGDALFVDPSDPDLTVPATDPEPETVVPSTSPTPSREANSNAPSRVRASMPAGELDPPPKPVHEPEPEPQPIWMADLAASRSGRDTGPKATGLLDRSGPADEEVRLTADELSEAAGIDEAALADLIQFGMLEGRVLGDDLYYDADALLIAKRSAEFMAHGVSARHLRMFKVAAEREAGFLEQMAMPMLKKRNPEARREAIAMLEELSDLGHELRAALLRANLRDHLHGS